MTLGKEHMNVLKADIDLGIAYDERHCAVARCLQRELGIEVGNMAVCNDNVAIDRPDGGVVYGFSPSLTQWIDNHDSWKAGEDAPDVEEPELITLTVYETHELDGPQGHWYDPRVHVGGD